MEYRVIDDEYAARFLGKRPEAANKHDFGSILCVCGSRGMHGAAVMSATAALKSGAGLVTVAVPREIETVVYPCFTEAMVRGYEAPRDIDALMEKSDVCLIGCGLGRSELSADMVRYVFENYKKTLIVDADGINILSSDIDMIKNTEASVILTPHAGEMARLSGLTSEEVEDDPEIVAVDTARALSAVVVLKGAATVIASPHKNGTVYVNHSGNPGMATAGSGDVLAGVTAALAAVIKQLYRAAACAVYVHGLAGDIAAEELSMTGMTAGDIIERLPRVFKRFE